MVHSPSYHAGTCEYNTYTVYTLCTVSKQTGYWRQKQEERERGRESVHGERVRGRKMMEEGEGGRACGRE